MTVERTNDKITQNEHKTVYLKDYKPYPFKIEKLDLNVDIQDGHTIVTAIGQYVRVNKDTSKLVLNGEALELLSLKVNGTEVSVDTYTVTDNSLTLPITDDKFELEIKTKIKPEENTRLEGLYKSGDTYCTQCEAEGFRRITYYPDRPDVLTVFTVRVEASDDFPILLSNGNKQDEGKLENNRHYVTWHDPFPKPCYLFALVAGNLNHIHDIFTTQSGRNVDLYIYVRPGDESQCDHAMRSLKNAMRWDEETYGLEYELDIFNIVAVSDFNMGAMENTSLNIFNTALVLAAQETATDQDFMRVESVIAHEYFHNWSGNRVTCRDWFQLSLKEGLTVFRDQEFSADLNSRDVQRIDDVTHLRRLQFSEDAGPLSHPIRPDNYIEINNFYTMTVYEKGAEVIRMLRTILGPENYRKGTDLYFSRHDGDAATCEDFVQAMQDASGIDLSYFRLWYEQSGTPEITFKGTYNEDEKSYSFDLEQKTPPSANQNIKKPLYTPVSIGFLGNSGEDQIPTKTVILDKEKQSFTVNNIVEKPVPSVLRGFSAPVKLYTDLNNAELSFLMLHDSDGFNRWEAGQQIYTRMLNHMIDEKSKDVCPRLLETIGKVIEAALESDADKALLSRVLTLPSISYIGQQRDVINPTEIHAAHQTMMAAIKRTHKALLEKIYTTNVQTGGFEITPQAMGERALRNTALSILTSTNGSGCAKRGKDHYETANNMTDRIAALSTLTNNSREEREHVFQEFYTSYQQYPLVVDKYFSLQAISTRKNIIEDLNKLKEHPDFNIKNPNRVRSLYAAFAMNNPVAFHAEDGSGYGFLTEAVITLNTINPQIASRLLTPLREWKRYTSDRQEKMKQSLERILAEKNLSPDVYEIASKSLKG